MRRIFWLLLINMFVCLLPAKEALAQGISTEGKDFWVGFLTNWLQSSNNPVVLELYISADDSTSGTVSIPKNPSFSPVSFNVYPNQTRIIQIPTSLGMATGTNLIQNKGIHVETDGVVSVYAMNKRQYSADMTVVLPTFSLGNYYYIMSHWEDGNRNNNANSDSEFVILAITDDTEVEITPSVTTRGSNPANVPFRVTLDRGQTYQVRAAGDLTGTLIRATNSSGCQDFAVFAGNMYTQVGECNVTNGHDHLYAQIYPTNTLGTEFIVVPLENRYGGDIIKLLATEDNTSIRANSSTYRLNAGEFVKTLSASVLKVTSDKPISVGQFSRTMDCDGTLGDPFVIPISPNEQLLKKITFNAPSIATISRYSLNIISKSTAISEVTVDGVRVGSNYNLVTDSEYAYARLRISGGTHTIRSNDGFIAYVYGFGRNESFGYATGASLGNLNIDFVIEDDNLDTPIDSLCLGSELSFTPIADTLYSLFEYDFGDGNTLMTTEDTTVSHQYNQPGRYIVKLTASTGGDDCSDGNEETSTKVIQVIEPQAAISGPRSVCPNTTDVSYFIREGTDHELDWFVKGGSLNYQSNDSITVDWLQTNPDAAVQVVATNRYGCTSDTIRHPVRINVQLDPEAPFGPDTLCSNAAFNVPYEAYYTNVSTYDWQTDFGTISGGHGTHRATVDWNGHGLGRLWFKQISTTDEICDGVSDTLHVVIERNPSETGRIEVQSDTVWIGQQTSFSLDVDTLYCFANWQIDEGFTADTVNAHQSLLHTFRCDGWHTINAIAYDTGTVCSDTRVFLTKQIFVVAPELEIVNVTKSVEADSALDINFLMRKATYYNKDLSLFRRKASETDWKLIRLLDASQRDYTDSDVDIHQHSYEYQISTNTDCENAVSSSIHQSILLEAEQSEDEAQLSWNSYEGWQNGVDQYEVWLSVDSGSFDLLQTTSDLHLAYQDSSISGFDYCFQVIARERRGNLSFSASNVECLAFIPEIKTYNVFTPNNDDEINAFFIIDNIEHYPDSHLALLNRSGKVIYEAIGYRNNWDGVINGRKVPSGTYFFHLQLNEPRNPLKNIKGWFSVLY